MGKKIEFNSKVIENEKGIFTEDMNKVKSGIHTQFDKLDDNIIILHIGNIPPNEKLIFITEFIQYTEAYNNYYEFEVFRNLPLIKIIKEKY